MIPKHKLQFIAERQQQQQQTTSTTMKEARVSASDQSITVNIEDVPVPKPGPSQVLIKVVVSGSNPKDWKIPAWMPKFQNTNTGDDIAGIVHAVGEGVTEFHVGDRVAAFHEMRTDAGSFAEYAIAWDHTTFHLPASTTFEEAAAIPLAAMTAAVGLFCRLGVPEPWVKTKAEREKMKGGVVVYGAASAVGAYAIKLLRRTGVHPIICIAGRGKDFVEGLIDRSQGDVIVDYRDGDEKVVEGMRNAVTKGEKLRYAFDAVSEKGSYTNICKVLDPEGGKAYLTVVLPGKNYEGISESINLEQTQVGSVHGEDKDFGYAWFRLFSRGLKEGWFSPHPHTVVPGGLGGIKEALENLRDGKASATKYVFKIDETEGVGKSVIQ